MLWTKTATRPAPSTGVTTMLATVCPARSTLTLEASGAGPPAPHTVTKPGAVASVAVTFRTAPDAWAAADPRSTIVVVPAASGAPVRVSSTRVGPVATNRPAVAVAAGCQAPTTSTTRSLADLGEDVDRAAVAERHDHQVGHGLAGPLDVQVRGLGPGQPGGPDA